MGIFVEPGPRPHPFNQQIMNAGQDWLATAMKQKERERVATGARATAQLLGLDPQLYSQLNGDQQKNVLSFLGQREKTESLDAYRQAKIGPTATGVTGGPTFSSENSQLQSDYTRRQQLDLIEYFKKDQFGNAMSFDFEKKGAKEALAQWRQLHDPVYEAAQRETFSRYNSTVPNYFQNGGDVAASTSAQQQATPLINLRKLQAQKPAQNYPNQEEILPGNLIAKSQLDENGNYRWNYIDQMGQQQNSDVLPEKITPNAPDEKALLGALTKSLPPSKHKGEIAEGKRGERFISDGTRWNLVDE